MEADIQMVSSAKHEESVARPRTGDGGIDIWLWIWLLVPLLIGALWLAKQVIVHQVWGFLLAE